MFNLPNQLTSLRLILSVVLVRADRLRSITDRACVLFIIAAGTDWLDGYYARKYGQVTTLGRILDPFADKVIVCGTFIFIMVAVRECAAMPWGLRAWMVVVIVGRELLVTALRSFIEERGSDFSANMSGKLKMVLQCVAAGVCLFYLLTRGNRAPRHWCWWLLVVSVWSAVILTVYSGLVYILRRDTIAEGIDRGRGMGDGGRKTSSCPVSRPSSPAHASPHRPTHLEPDRAAGHAGHHGICRDMGNGGHAMVARKTHGALSASPAGAMDRAGPDLRSGLLPGGADVCVRAGHGAFDPAAPAPAAAKGEEATTAHVVAQLISDSNVWVLLLCLVSVAIVAPVSEEFFFRVLLQGWLESKEQRWQRQLRIRGLRIARDMIPILPTALIFAGMHFRGAAPPVNARLLIIGLSSDAVAKVLTLAVAVQWLRIRVGATAADFGWAPGKLRRDIELGLASFAAVAAPIYAMQIVLFKVFPKYIAPDPLPLFSSPWC